MYRHLKNTQLLRGRTSSIQKVQRGGLQKALAEAIRSILRFK